MILNEFLIKKFYQDILLEFTIEEFNKLFRGRTPEEIDRIRRVNPEDYMEYIRQLGTNVKITIPLQKDRYELSITPNNTIRENAYQIGETLEKSEARLAELREKGENVEQITLIENNMRRLTEVLNKMLSSFSIQVEAVIASVEYFINVKKVVNPLSVSEKVREIINVPAINDIALYDKRLDPDDPVMANFTLPNK